MSLRQLDEARLKAAPSYAPYVPEQLVTALNKVGRPTAYRPDFCQVLLDDAAIGHILGATAALIGVTRSTLLVWAGVHPQFAEALALAKGLRQRMYEGHLIDIARRGGDSTRMSAIKLGLLNVAPDDWKGALDGGAQRHAQPRWADRGVNEAGQVA